MVEDGRVLLKAAEELRPDVILLDISMPLLNGIEAARACSDAVAAAAGVDPQAVLPFSTGVIGEPLPVALIETAIPAAIRDPWIATLRGRSRVTRRRCAGR